MKTIVCLFIAFTMTACIEITGFDVKTAPTHDDVVGDWRGFANCLYTRVQFMPDGTGVLAMGLPGTNVEAVVFDLSWHTTASELVIEMHIEGADQPDRLIGRLLERTLVLNDLRDDDKRDVPLAQLIRMEDCTALDKDLEKLMQNHRSGMTIPGYRPGFRTYAGSSAVQDDQKESFEPALGGFAMKCDPHGIVVCQKVKIIH